MKNPLAINQEKETKKIVSFLKKTFKQQKINKAVIGLSGGIDSSVCYFLLKQVLPKKNIIAVHLPYYEKNPLVFQVVDEKNLYIIDIKEPVKKIIKENTDRVRLANIIARTRMIVLFDLAKKNKALVCGTENKSEKLLGYFTRFGDGASDIEPIRHLYKTQIFYLAKYLKIPDEIINQAPSANLWPGQTDEGEFGFTYENADKVLYLYFDKKLTVGQIKKKGYKNAEKIIKRVRDNEFKQKTPYRI